MTKPAIRALALLLAPALIPAALGAQEDPLGITLADALALAKRESPAYRRALARLDAAGVQVRAGWGAFLPDIRGDLSFAGTTGSTVTGQDDFGRATSLPEAVDFEQSSATQTLSSSITIFDGLQNLNNLRASQADRNASWAGVAIEVNRVEAEVARRFFSSLTASRLISLEEDLLESAREQLDANTRLFRVAAADQVDVLGAQVDVAQQELALERARNDREKVLLELKEQIGLLEEFDVEPVGELPRVFDPAALSVDSLIEEAFQQNPQLTQFQARLRASERRASAARGLRLPSISASAAYRRSVSLNSYDALFELNPRNESLQFQFGLSLPIFTNFETSQRIAEADLTRREAEENLREERLQLEREVRSALIDLENAHQSVLLARRSAELSRRRVELAREQFRLGAIAFTNLQSVIGAASQSERDLINRELEFAQAWVTLQERVGSPTSE